MKYEKAKYSKDIFFIYFYIYVSVSIGTYLSIYLM